MVRKNSYRCRSSDITSSTPHEDWTEIAIVGGSELFLQWQAYQALLTSWDIHTGQGSSEADKDIDVMIASQSRFAEAPLYFLFSVSKIASYFLLSLRFHSCTYKNHALSIRVFPFNLIKIVRKGFMDGKKIYIQRGIFAIYRQKTELMRIAT
jgi:hypothetical protein